MTLRLEEHFKEWKVERLRTNGGGFEKDLGDSAGGKTRAPRGEPGGAPGESPLVLSESKALERAILPASKKSANVSWETLVKMPEIAKLTP